MKFILFALLPMMAFAQHNHSIEIQGHRGCRGLMPENTIPAFKKALELGVETLELDVVISKDKKIVVSHEPFFNPVITTSPSGIPLTSAEKTNLFQMDYATIKKFDVGMRGNPGYPEQQKIAIFKPLLEDVFEEISRFVKEKGIHSPKYNIEIKSDSKEYGISQPNVEEFSDLVYRCILEHIPLESVNIQSFDFNVLRFWNHQISSGKYKKIALSVLIEPNDNNEVAFVLEELGFIPDIWSPYFTKLDVAKVNLLHQKSIRVIPWTINKREDMEKMKGMGCDGIITDYPDRAKGL